MTETSSYSIASVSLPRGRWLVTANVVTLLSSVNVGAFEVMATARCAFQNALGLEAFARVGGVQVGGQQAALRDVTIPPSLAAVMGAQLLAIQLAP